MSDSNSLFSREENILQAGKEILDQNDKKDTIPKKEFEKLLSHYKKLYKKMKHLVEISDKQQRELQRLNKEKTIFFINIAHEIKTPLTLIKNYLNKYIGERGINKDLSIIKENFDKLTDDIINFLDVEKIERGQIFYNHNKIVHLSDFLQKKILLFQEVSKKKNITISPSIERSLFTMIDPSAFDRIINNLLDNALKFTDPEGQIIVTLKSGGTEIILQVKDTGIGISSGQLKNIFKPYYQISNTKRNIQGIGMGLHIVKKIVHEAGGKISVKSREGKGSEFTILLKKYLVTDDTVPEKDYDIEIPGEVIKRVRLKEKNISSEKYNILVLEDNEDLLAFLQNSMCKKYNIFFALNGKMALRKLKDIPQPHLILSDIMMDEMDGYLFFEELKKRKVYDSIPFIFMTARSSREEKVRGISRGAVDFISKPFDINELIAKIDALITMQEAHRLSGESEIEKRIIKAIRNRGSDDEGFYHFEENCRKFGFTKKEKEIAGLLLKGKEDKEVAYELHISYNTLRTHVKNIYNKCRVQNKVELVNTLRK
ncbi:MAG: response regulator [Spirochaetales bacterium]|nr:response regulator [Spirochaetales bacterium]